MILDPMYFVFLAPGLLLSLWASWRVKSAFNKWSQEPTMRRITGAEVAQRMLANAGIHDVTVVPHDGFLTDHYNPASKQLALSHSNYYGYSVAAAGIAAHEAGHALQHATHYKPLWVRSALVPTANIGSSIGYLLMVVGVFMSVYMVLAGAALFSMVLLFQIVTLPVEFDASNRAKRLLVEQGIIYPEERYGVDKVLNAAALTYVAAVVNSLLLLLYFLWRSGLLGGGSRN